jgi:hypothetical protein
VYARLVTAIITMSEITAIYLFINTPSLFILNEYHNASSAHR